MTLQIEQQKRKRKRLRLLSWAAPEREKEGKGVEWATHHIDQNIAVVVVSVTSVDIRVSG
jgi:hypothetical protein